MNNPNSIQPTIQKNESGFSLVELMVSVGILSILTSLSLVQGGHLVAKAHDTRRIMDVHVLRRAFDLYYAEKERFPDFINDGISRSGNYIGQGEPIDALIAPYIEDGKIPNDPMNAADPSIYFYSFDPEHCLSESLTVCNCAAAGPIYGVNKFEGSHGLMGVTKVTCNGADKNLHHADGNWLLMPKI